MNVTFPPTKSEDRDVCSAANIWRQSNETKMGGQCLFENFCAVAESILYVGIYICIYSAEFLRTNTCEFHSYIVCCTVVILSCNIFIAGYNKISNCSKSSVVTILSACCSFIKLWNYETVYFCISYDSYNRQRLIP